MVIWSVSRQLNIEYPKITPKASVAITNYSLKNNPNINRTVFGTGLDIDFTLIILVDIFGNTSKSPYYSFNFL